MGSRLGHGNFVTILQPYKQTSPHRYIHVRNQTTVAEWEAAEDYYLRQAMQLANHGE